MTSIESISDPESINSHEGENIIEGYIPVNEINYLWTDFTNKHEYIVRTCIINFRAKRFIDVKNKNIKKTIYNKLTKLLYIDRLHFYIKILYLLIIITHFSSIGLWGYINRVVYRSVISLISLFFLTIPVIRLRFLSLVLGYSLIQIIFNNCTFISYFYLLKSKPDDINKKELYYSSTISLIEVLLYMLCSRLIIIYFKIKQQLNLI